MYYRSDLTRAATAITIRPLSETTTQMFVISSPPRARGPGYLPRFSDSPRSRELQLSRTRVRLVKILRAAIDTFAVSAKQDQFGLNGGYRADSVAASAVGYGVPILTRVTCHN